MYTASFNTPVMGLSMAEVVINILILMYILDHINQCKNNISLVLPFLTMATDMKGDFT